MNITKNDSGIIVVTFPYNPLLVEKVKTVPSRKWHPEGKHWSFPDSDGILEKILKAFEGEEVPYRLSIAGQTFCSCQCKTRRVEAIPNRSGTQFRRP